MPDWFYRTVAQRTLFFLPQPAGRAVALGTIGILGRSSPGRSLIQLLGHMAPDPRLEFSLAGTKFSSPIGLGWRVDPERRATLGLSGFGVGCIEINVFRVRVFDTLHAFVAAVLFQITVQIMVGDVSTTPAAGRMIEREDVAWRRAQWGQLFWVIHAVGLGVAGGIILAIGMTQVFVSEDLGFLCMTEAQARELGSRMIGVVAHDRATLGGMLLASGVAMLLPVLWCVRRGESWLWWAIAGLGTPAYAAALGVHFKVAYTDWRHMAPACAGFGLWLAGLALTRSYLTKTKNA